MTVLKQWSQDELTQRKSRTGTAQGLLAARGVQWVKVVYMAEIGSVAQGVSSDSSDFDATVVRVEPWEELIVGEEGRQRIKTDNRRQSMQIRTQPDGNKSRLGDVDLNVYTLRKFAGLAAKGNPSILEAIFSPLRYKTSRVDFDRLARIVASRRAANAYLGYMTQQLDRWVGARGQKNVSRPELVEEFGFDTKYAAHVVRLGLQGKEYLESGRVVMPMSELQREVIVGIRTGEYTEREALALAHRVEEELKDSIGSSPLPENPGNWRGWVAEEYAGLFDIDVSGVE